MIYGLALAPEIWWSRGESTVTSHSAGGSPANDFCSVAGESVEGSSDADRLCRQ